ncbi:MAG: PKD domain-containing protein [Deltaproteobacteria bacterium]|nr:PKD domain-containing protein [Deltaproteobacteria bacterium]
MLRSASLLALLALCACGGRDSFLNGPPTVAIDAPVEGATVAAQTALVLNGEAKDTAGAAITGAGLVWTSDKQGKLGTGALLTVSLGVGAHELTLTATDAGGSSGRAVVHVTAVAAANHPPTVSITSPATGAQVVEGTPITFAGAGTDPEDGALPGSSLQWSSSIDGALGSGATVSATLSRGTHQIVLAGTDKAGATAYATISVAIAPVGTNLPPVVTITSPQPNASSTQGVPVQLSGSATDPEDGALSDGALTWSSDLDGALGAGGSLQVSNLSLGVHTITLTAQDSHALAGSAQVLISIVQAGNHAPVATITAPTSGSAFFVGQAIALAGSATDAEDGVIADAHLAWTSSKDGALGTGHALSLTTLTVGAHTLTLKATDAQGAQGAAQVSITVLAQNTAPTVTITAPASGSTFTQGDTIGLRGSATDAEDGPLSGSALTWSSSLDGALGHGASLDFSSLRAGAHTITLSAADSGGRIGTAQIDLTVQASQVNLPPVARLSGPATADAGASVSLDGSASSDPDGTIVSYAFDFGDGSPVQTGTTSTAAHSYGAPATPTVTLTVTDNQGATGTATLHLTIVKPAQIPVVADDTGETLGHTCSIALDASDVPQVAYRDLTHTSVRWARQTGLTTWERESVDGLGYEIGGLPTGGVALALAPSGTPLIAYRLSNGIKPGLWLATRTSSWTRQSVDADPAGFDGERVGLVLSPTTHQPFVAYTLKTSGYDSVAFSWTSNGGGAWTRVVPRFLAGTGNAAYDQLFDGGLTYANGTLSMSFIQRYAVGYAGTPGLGAWSVTSTSTPAVTFVGNGPSVGTPVALRNGDPLVMLATNVEHLVGGVTGTAQTLSPYTITAATQAAMTVSANGTIWLAYQRGTDLELAYSGDGDYWVFKGLGPMDAATPGIAIASDGTAKVCFFRGGKLLVY